MGYQFTIVRLKQGSEQELWFPANLVELPRNPIAGPFDEQTRARLIEALARFPDAQPVAGMKSCFLLENALEPTGRLEAWMTGDGHLFLETEAELDLVLELFIYLRLSCDDLAIEDVQRGVLHTRRTFTAWLKAGDQQQAAA